MRAYMRRRAHKHYLYKWKAIRKMELAWMEVAQQAAMEFKKTLNGETAES